MIDPTPNELAAIEHGGRMGGEYLDSIAKTDLAAMSVDEWLVFLEVVVTGYCDSLRDLAAHDSERLKGMEPDIPF